MDILFTTEYYPPFVRGGGEISTKIIAEELAKKHKVTVLTPNYGSRRDEIKNRENKVNVHRFVFRSHAPINTKSNLAQKKSVFNFIHFLYVNNSARVFKKQIEKYLEKNKPDIIHAHNLESVLGLADVGTEAKKVAHVRDSRLLENKYKKKLKKFDLVLTNSNFMAKECKKQGIEAKTLYNPVDKKILSKLSKKQAKKRLGVEKAILFVGGLERKKGAHLLKDFAKKLPDYSFLVVGKGSLEYDPDFMSNMPRNMNLFLFVPYEDLSLYYRAADILVVPSLWQEPFGRVVIEAYANATPVIATKVGGLPELVDSKTGFLIDAKNAEKITDVIKKTNRKRLDSLSRAAYKKSKEFESQKIVKKLISEYKNLF